LHADRPRAKEFDPEVALRATVKVFWRLGYERTSLDLLMREKRISAQSLYVESLRKCVTLLTLTHLAVGQ
jgi:hypothetical protein